MILIWLTLSHGRLGGRQIIAEGFKLERFPVDAVRWGRDHQLHGRMFHEFIWGGYLLYAWPEMKVFIDGGSDFYGGEFLRAHRHVVNIQPGWRDSLDVWRIDLALVANGGALASELLRDPDWSPGYCDGTAVLLHRAGTAGDSVPRAGCHIARADSLAGK
jgi:hypothetical protein